jgi:hypothetical protein
VLTAYTTADRLIKVIIKKSTAQLLTSLRLITFLTTQGSTTINLAFATKKILNRLLKCRIASELDFSSDY